MGTDLREHIERIQKEIDFSGSILIKQRRQILAKSSYGYANRADKVENEIRTRYGIASGCKIFTAVAISQLVEEGKLSFDTKLKECLDSSFPNFDESITIHHLLTHTSGIPDYFDEEIMDDFEELWIESPMYHMRSLSDFLPLFQQAQMKFSPGEKFHYNNAGFIVLGLIIEKVSGLEFKDYVQKHIFEKAEMTDSGYFALDSLPGKTAIGYIDHEDGTWRTNMYSLPIQGGSDGGAFVTVGDMLKFWEALTNHVLLSESLTKTLLTPHVQEQADDFYGYGVWIKKKDDTIFKYHLMGYDPGVCFHSAYYPETDIQLAVCANISSGAYKILNEIEKQLS
ncbi:serine hydrolase [Psychrobacillus sp. OK032]|uniref:serine hydrolase domain-containing protein n=1 Tax=Psychrobacillus sp. OK032 TaxID=1884358 RepID=UPI0008D2BFF1|nr:serine hydrolase [Psychrobacillus sp. OK032]SES40319.1 CubicO group peptidase, beta-lactamase class C family [Psychrobacillus sp. OK032]